MQQTRADIAPDEQARRWILGGRIQGVGFRPFVYRLAHQFGLQGWVRNRVGQVEIFAQGAPVALAAFGQALLSQAPPVSRPRQIVSEDASLERLQGFTIRSSAESSTAHIHLPPDAFTCDACLEELRNPLERRYRYPFINCTQCGPRYTIIERLPYDRPNTTMADFPLCSACRDEYENPLDRRFHAQPLACPDCGPRIEFRSANHTRENEAALAACSEALRAGRTVAVKGVGGYHLMCDAGNREAVLRLRQRKPRPAKPLAVLFPAAGADSLDALRREVAPSAEEARLLRDPMRPIVLIRKRSGGTLPEAIAPGLAEIGVMLPYSPLHHLLLEDFGGPVVATSANLSGEPVLTDNTEVEARLHHVADAFLHHNRPIRRPADDPVFRSLGGRPRPLRRGRGCAPLELNLPFVLNTPAIAVGAHMKNTVALAWDDRVVVSPHIGELSSPRSLAVFRQVIDDLQRLYKMSAQAVVCDAHPGYASTRWALGSGLPVQRVFHHHAHAAALAGEHPDDQPWLVFTWDGVGYGEDASLWGGEALLGRPGAWRRVAHMRPFHVPGGEKAGREPWRSAAAVCWQAGIDWRGCPDETGLLYQAWQRRLNAPQNTAAGRLFDAAAALAGFCLYASFEGEGPMRLEAAASEGEGPRLPVVKNEQGLWETDWTPLVPYLLDASISTAERAAGFHKSLAYAALDQALRIREEHGTDRVGLSGGVFQNRTLTQELTRLLSEHGFDVKLPEQVPCNDAGISFGQIIEFGSLRHNR